MSARQVVWAIALLLAGGAAGMTITASRTTHGSPPAAASEPRRAALPAPEAGAQPFVEVARAVTPAVVNISATRVTKMPQGNPFGPFMEDPMFRRFFGEEFFRQFEVPRERRDQSLGSGVIVDPSGLIITNNHVVAQATEIKVLLGDKREFKGRVIGTDPKTDVAVIKIEAKGLPAIPWGDSSRLQVGEYVLAIGNPFGLNQTVTMGIISAVGRASVGIAEYEDFIQTDAAINPGNSGGALVNVRGELIGINTAIVGQGNLGIGFAVPSNMARAVMEPLVKTGKVVRGWLGVSIRSVTEELAKRFGLKDLKGALVGEVLPNSPAERAGIKPGDVIIAYNGAVVDDPNHFRNMVAETPLGKTVRITLMRDRQSKEVEATISGQPSAATQASEGEEQTTQNALAGIAVQDLTPELAKQLGLARAGHGVVIVSVEPGTAAEQAGLQSRDIILEINRQPVRDTKAFSRLAARLSKEESVLLLVNRQGRSVFLTVAPR